MKNISNFDIKIKGIYKISNLINNKIYIGSSNNCYLRYNQHKTNLNTNKHCNKKLQNSWNKHGKNNFVFEVIEIVDKIDDLLVREQFYLDTLSFIDVNKTYNIATIAGNTLGIKMSEEGKQQRSLTLRDKYSGELSSNYKGGYIKPKNKLESQKSEINNDIIIGTRQAEKSGKEIIQYDNEMNVLKEWASIKSASDTLKIQRHSIKKCCEGNSRHAGFFIWRFKGDENIEYEFRKNYIIQLDNDNIIINEFDQIVIAAEKLKIPRKGITKALKSGETYCGFYWKYK